MQTFRRRATYLLTFSLFFTFSSSAFSNAADIPNGKCSTLGKTVMIKGIKYLCSKNGKNQIWIKTAGASAEDAKLESLYNEVKLRMDKSDPKFDISINIDPQLNKSGWSKDSVAGIGSATKLLQAMGVKTSTQMKIYISWGM